MFIKKVVAVFSKSSCILLLSWTLLTKSGITQKRDTRGIVFLALIARKEHLFILLSFKPLALELFEIIKFIEIGDFFVFENFIKDFKLLPLPEIKTAVLIFL